jgi:MoxR-like ATPase
MAYQYQKVFNPAPTPPASELSPGTTHGDSRAPYHYGDDESGDEIVLAVNVALVTKRPLLMRGAPGCGKSSLARDVARVLDRTYYEFTVTSRTTARDLCWRFDTVRRLSDAHSADEVRRKYVDQPARYLVPGPLWWAFEPASAGRRGIAPGDNTLGLDDLADPGVGPKTGTGAVLLIDEIDKAEPDVPNDLLIPLGSGRFDVDEIPGPPIQSSRPLLVLLTTNEERDLPPAFVRRCIVLELKRPTLERAMTIARAHFPAAKIDDDRLRILARRFDELAADAESRNLRPPGTAEYLDAIAACVELGVNSGSRAWEAATNRAFWKHADTAPPFKTESPSKSA